jgi:hypothetical protein|tara:strand:- start:38 stop:331 length:294 start_codon:yes stop_codon:yes gene_type:complete
MPNTEQTAIVSSDGQVKAGPGHVSWILVATGGTGGAWQLNDGLTDGGSATDLVSGIEAADTTHFIRFGALNDGALRFGTGIFADIPGTNVTLTVGYA